MFTLLNEEPILHIQWAIFYDINHYQWFNGNPTQSSLKLKLI